MTEQNNKMSQDGYLELLYKDLGREEPAGWRLWSVSEKSEVITKLAAARKALRQQEAEEKQGIGVNGQLMGMCQKLVEAGWIQRFGSEWVHHKPAIQKEVNELYDFNTLMRG